ncbi:MAG: hypothetical protein M1817_000348 [Caeruleum heppii]|nr:MAG: hypothetical protein M1817_000348 [Caeruleum heppii]
MSGTSCEQDIKHDGVVAQTEEHLSLPSPDSFDPLEAARSEASWMRGDVKSVRRSTSSNPAAFTIYQDDLPREVRHDAKDIGQHSPSFEVSNPTRTSSKAEPAASAIHERLGSQSYRVKRLSGRHPSHGPTLRISPDADRLVLGDHSSDKVHSTGSKFGKKATNLHRAVVTSELMKSSQWGKPKVERMPKSRPHSASAYFGSRDENTMTPQRQQSRPMSVVCYSSPSDQNQTISRRQDRLPLAVQPSHPPIDTSLLPVHPLSLDIETKPPDLISDEEPVQISQTDSQNPIPDSNDPRLAPKVTTAPAHARIVRSESTPTTQHSPPRNTVQQIRYATDADDCISPVLQMVSEDRTVDSLKYGYPAASASEHSITVRGGQGQRVASPLPQSDRVASPASENDVRPRQRTAKLAKTSAEAQKQSTTGPGIPSMQVDCNAGKTSNRGNRRSQKPTSTGTAKKPLKADSHGESQSKKILSMNHLRSLFRSTARGSSADIERAAPHFTDDGLGKLSKDSRDSQCVPMLGNDKHINRVLEASGGGSTPATDVASAASKPGISHGQNRASSDGFTRPTAFAMHLLKSARNETQTPKKEQLLEMGKVMVDAITSARDADRAQEEAKVAAGRAEMAAVMTRKSVVRMTDLLREWQQDATKAVGQDEVKRRL